MFVRASKYRELLKRKLSLDREIERRYVYGETEGSRNDALKKELLELRPMKSRFEELSTKFDEKVNAEVYTRTKAIESELNAAIVFANKCVEQTAEAKIEYLTLKKEMSNG